jgi:hypothetical protein
MDDMSVLEYYIFKYVFLRIFLEASQIRAGYGFSALFHESAVHSLVSISLGFISIILFILSRKEYLVEPALWN